MFDLAPDLLQDSLQLSYHALQRDSIEWYIILEYGTPQPLYSTIVGVQNIFRVSYPIRVITRVKHIDI